MVYVSHGVGCGVWGVLKNRRINREKGIQPGRLYPVILASILSASVNAWKLFFLLEIVLHPDRFDNGTERKPNVMGSSDLGC